MNYRWVPSFAPSTVQSGQRQKLLTESAVALSEADDIYKSRKGLPTNQGPSKHACLEMS